MTYIIDNLLYDTEKMEKISGGAKVGWKSKYPTQKSFYSSFLFWVSGIEYAKDVMCAIYKSKKNNYLAIVLDSDGEYSDYAFAIPEEEAKQAILSSDPKQYLKLWHDIEEA